jgi:AcrR family transcriptional regulator
MKRTERRLIRAYIDYVSEHRKKPKSVEAFSAELNLKEGTFFKYFDSFNDLEKFFWKNLFLETVIDLEKDEVFASYSVNEKLLAFYFTWIEKIKPERDYAKYVIREEKFYELYPACFDEFKNEFEKFVSGLITQGLATEEIAERKFITDKYAYMLWYQPVFILKFWVKDESMQFEDTDALIEKTVNFSFDLMRSNGFDSLYDLAKFRIQHFKI